MDIILVYHSFKILHSLHQLHLEEEGGASSVFSTGLLAGKDGGDFTKENNGLKMMVYKLCIYIYIYMYISIYIYIVLYPICICVYFACAICICMCICIGICIVLYHTVL